MNELIGLIPLFPLLGFLIVGLLNKNLSKGIVSVIACGSVLISFVIAILAFIQILQAPEGQTSLTFTVFEWINTGGFSAPFAFLVDPLSGLMLLIITGVGFLIHLYSVGYMHDDAGFNRFFAYLNLFIFFMLVLVMGSNYLMMFVGWEGVGLCSYLLIGFWFKNQEYNNAAKKAFIMNRIGDLGLILGIFMIFINFGSIQYAEVFAKAAGFSSGDQLITIITLLLFVGAIGKSAQIPLYTWLPDAMAGPTPVSALIHAATMVTAGIYMIARNNILYTLAPLTLEIVLIIGLATSIFAATIAVAQNDIKKVLAYSTVSQLGLMFVALGLGAYSTGVFHMATHAFFKALLFLGAGSVIHGMSGDQDIRNMGGLSKKMKTTFFTFLIGTLAISGIPPFAGFFSKDEILTAAFEHNIIIWALALFASLLTAFYMFRLLFLTFSGESRASHEVQHHIHESPKSMWIPLAVLAVLSAIGGFMGVPEALGGSHALGSFLDPVFAGSKALAGEGHHLGHSTEYTLMGVVVALTIVLIVVAYSMYVKGSKVPGKDESAYNPLHKILYNKYYIDELYDALFVKPTQAISRLFDSLVDRLVIDNIVNGIGKSVVWGSRTLRLIQDGNIGFYVFVMVISIIVIVVAKSFL
jgi:NADH-quinone oxidoreductase subunit L